MLRRRRLLTPFLVSIAALCGDLAAQERRLGAEFQVNTYTFDTQEWPAVAVGADGGFVVAWGSKEQDGSDLGVFARLYSSLGTALATEFRVNTYTDEYQHSPAVAMLGPHGFVVTWNSTQLNNQVIGRRFASDGSAVGDEFLVSSTGGGAPRDPAVAADAEGDFVVAWTSVDQDGSSYGVFARRFASSGAPLGADFQINVFFTGTQATPSIAADADGDFVVAWHSIHDGDSGGVFARRFSSAGAPLTGEMQVNVYTTQAQQGASVASDADGDFVVAWQSYQQDGAYAGVFARLFSSSGSARSGEMQVNSHFTYGQVEPSVAAAADGDFVVAWTSYGQDGSVYGVVGRRFSSAGVGAAEFQVNAYTFGDQSYPSVAMNESGHFVIAWTDWSRDSGGRGIFAQRFATPLLADVDGNGVADPLTDGLLLLRYLFGFRGATLVDGAVADDCARCDPEAIEAYLATLVG